MCLTSRSRRKPGNTRCGYYSGRKPERGLTEDVLWAWFIVFVVVTIRGDYEFGDLVSQLRREQQ